MAEEMMGAIENLRNPSIGPIDFFSLPSWKLYDNPHYSFTCLPPHVSVSASKLTSLFRPCAEEDDELTSELELALARIEELKVELELERRMRKRVESLNRTLARDLAEERKARQAAESLRAKLEEELEIAKEEIEEERQMLIVADVWREERVQMKLAEAKLIMEEKLQKEPPPPPPPPGIPTVITTLSSNENKGNGNHGGGGGGSGGAPASQQRREVENPHIKRGIKGSVEFPKVVRRDGTKVAPQLGFSLECQKAQLMILMKHHHHKTPPDNLVM
ncbi:hypothetical protein J5N97_021647 [Dioscorea zingiberensis]|uniref:Uncharacterized protein n=1 Tax=Dioscorea zingiberensis TaxID=325984 RepID=A0A9D5CAD8_9LILI|nr:hypothetical protein J5N97_021647 [Dioscorea zingiberensis]